MKNIVTIKNLSKCPTWFAVFNLIGLVGLRAAKNIVQREETKNKFTIKGCTANKKWVGTVYSIELLGLLKCRKDGDQEK